MRRCNCAYPVMSGVSGNKSWFVLFVGNVNLSQRTCYWGTQNWRWWENEIICWRLLLNNLSIHPAVGPLLVQSMQLSCLGRANDAKLCSRAIPDKAPLLCYFKLCASFCSHWWIQTGVTVWKGPIWVKIGDFLSPVTLKFDGRPWKQ